MQYYKINKYINLTFMLMFLKEVTCHTKKIKYMSKTQDLYLTTIPIHTQVAKQSFTTEYIHPYKS